MAESTSGSRWRPRSAVLVAAFVFALTAALAVVRDRLLDGDLRSMERAAVLERLGPYAHALSLAVDRRTAVLLGLKAFVEVRWGSPAFEHDFDAFAQAVESSTPGIRTLQYVVERVVRRTYPSVGNEPIIGFDLTKHPDPEVLRDLLTAEMSRSVVLTGPLQLEQGGAGVLARIAARDPAGKLLCVVTAVLDLEPLLREAQIDRAPGLLVSLVNEHGRVLAGPPPVVAGAGQPALVEVVLPDRRWHLAARPAGGWGSSSTQRLFAGRAGSLVLCLLLSAIAYLLTARQAARARERLERARHLDDERFARLYQLIPDGVVLTRLRDDAMIEVNETFLAFSRYTRGELIGRTALEVKLWDPPHDRALLIETLEKEGIVRNRAHQMRRGDGSTLEVDGSFRIFDLQGESCMLSIVREMTEARELQLKLLQAQKMEAIGTLAGGVAHDFNNIVTVILSYAELASQELPEGAAAREDLQQIMEASKRAAALVRQLLTFSRRQVLQPRAVDVSAQANETRLLLERLLPSNIQLVTSLAQGLPPVLVDPGQLEQVLMNLAVNARDAMPEGGTLEIVTAREDGSVLLSVRDTGKGVSKELQARIFEPFFTTKAPGKGTGLGLATCHGIVQQAGGRIELRSAAEKGTTFRVLLPAMQEAAPRPGTPEPSLVPQRGSETILLAEDEPQLRAAIARMLAGLGYRVIAAADGAEALALARAHASHIELLITDVMMPGLRGPELAERLLQERASVRTLFISGYAHAAALEPARRDGAGFLGKPFTLEQLAAAVRERLDRR